MNGGGEDALEFRLHGIGNHSEWSALGAPGAPTGRAHPEAHDESMVSVYLPPRVNESVRIVNWSRTSRWQSTFMWYAALPFSMCNLIGYMAVPRVFAHSVSTLATVCLVLWIIVIVETIIGSFSYLGSDELLRVLLWISVIFIMSCLARVSLKRQTDQRASGTVGWWHVIVMYVVAVTSLSLSPKNIEGDWIPDWARVECFAGASCWGRSLLDPVLAFVLVSTYSVLIVAILCSFWCIITRYKEHRSLCGALILACVSVFFLNFFMSSVRFALAVALMHLSEDISDPLEYTGVVGEYYSTFRSVLPFRPGKYGFYPSDYVALVPMAIILFFIVSLSLASFIILGKAKVPHRKLRYVTKRLKVITFVSSLSTALLSSFFFFFRDIVPDSLWIIVKYLQIFGAIGAVVALVIFSASSRGSKIRDILDAAADVIGYWKVQWHPLGGASYRPRVLEGIVKEMRQSGAKKFALVGHSQGSVIASAIVGRMFEARDFNTPKDDIILVTSGSPLVSLYGSFFPSYFNITYFKTVRDRCAQWTNFWRSTDTISSVIPYAKNVRLEDFCRKGHSDYWTDERRTSVVERFLSGR